MIEIILWGIVKISIGYLADIWHSPPYGFVWND